MQTSTIKLMSTKLEVYQAYTYFNVHVFSNVHYGCGIIKFSEQQCAELKKICERPIVIKLGLGVPFPRILLCMRKGALGVGLTEP